MTKTNTPKSRPNGLIPTLNQMGFEWPNNDSMTQRFLKDFIFKGSKVLEMGAAYGRFSQDLINAGAKVIANDLNETHIKILNEKIKNPNLEVIVGRFPDDLSFAKNQFDAAYSSRMIQFLSPEKFSEGLKKLSSWIKPNGYLCLLTLTPYRDFVNGFASEFEQRKLQNDPWPGHINDYYKWIPKDYHNKIPKEVNLFDRDLLQLKLKDAGFSTIQCNYLGMQASDEDPNTQPRANVGIIAQNCKPV